MEKILLSSVIFVVYLTVIQGSVLRVVGGYGAPETYGRFHASLQNLNRSHVCGGAVVSDRHIVTAAHCVHGADPEYIKVVVGTTNLNRVAQRYNVIAIYINDKFDFLQRRHDIAVIKVCGTFVNQHVDILELGDNHLNEGDPVILSGFGSQEPQGDTSLVMNALNLSVFDQETCKYAMRNTRNVTDEMFCTFSGIGEGTCHGDSGGPLIQGDKLVGVVSWGIPCAAGFPDVHTRIAPYVGWIQEVIKNTSKCRKPKPCGLDQN
ncbi:trypsin domain-containing protein [Phthorimaea operculella]|nr:trypsin domain-containing protein [Phthorimaea operculella]